MKFHEDENWKVDESLCEEPEWLKDIRHVGFDKPLGYLPLYTIGDSMLILQLMMEAQSRGLSYLIFKEGDCSIGTGALYIYDEIPLLMLLSKYKEVLLGAGVSIHAKGFISDIAKRTIHSKEFPEAYRVIGLAFADKRFTK